MQYLHKQQIAHRDISPESVYLTSTSPLGDVKLSNFGSISASSNNLLHTGVCKRLSSSSEKMTQCEFIKLLQPLFLLLLFLYHILWPVDLFFFFKLLPPRSLLFPFLPLSYFLSHWRPQNPRWIELFPSYSLHYCNSFSWASLRTLTQRLRCWICWLHRAWSFGW